MDSIQVLEGPTTHKGLPLVVGTIDAKTLAEKCKVPRRDFKAKTGYQREISVTRVNKLVADLEKYGVDLPTAVLLSLRDFDPEKDLTVGNGHRMLQLHSDLFVVDGQHRVEALRRLVDKDPEKWSGYRVPFVCMLGANERQEMKQFYVVNSTAKSVRTDLAWVLLKDFAESDAHEMKALIEKRETWKVISETLAEELERRCSVWRHRVRFPGQDKGESIINNSGLAASLKQLLDTPYFGQITGENQLKILDAYWQAIRELLPKAFEKPTNEEPGEYALQKSSPGAWVMHGLLISIIEYLKSAGKSVIERDSYSDVLRDVFEQLEENNGEGVLVSGADFWRSGVRGAAGAFSSHGGRRVLLARMREYLPEVSVE